ncbi:MAG: hypothetical protein J0L64_26990 [Acidobacteria bacterium]|nr:hypothetical protein [Acidobacteriota bacterium]
MNLTITLPDPDSRVLQEKAHAQGLTPEQYARQLIERDLAPDWLRNSWSNAEQASLGQLSFDEIEAEIAAARRIRRTGNPHPGA